MRNKPLTIEELDQLNNLILDRGDEILKVGVEVNIVGTYRATLPGNEPTVLYFLPNQEPPLHTTLIHPVTSQGCTVTGHCQEAGRIKTELFCFDHTAAYYDTAASYDYSRAQTFHKLLQCAVDVPVTFNRHTFTLLTPVAQTPYVGHVVKVFPSDVAYQVTDVTQLPTHTKCQLRNYVPGDPL